MRAFWEAGTAAGYHDDGAPGPRPQYAPDYFGAFLLDPDGNGAEAVHGASSDRAGLIDHLWIRVADVAAAKRFYSTVAPFTGFAPGDEAPDRVQFRSPASSFSLVAGKPSRNIHLAFGTGTDETVHAFHRAATEAGYPDNGAPGERPVYHPGYYGAFVCDPDGNNVEVVNHHRKDDA